MIAIDNEMLPYRCRQYRRDIDLYIDSKYAGFQRLETIEEYFEEYKALAEEKAKITPWDSVVLYAIFEYDRDSGAFLSANFMVLEIPEKMYADLYMKIKGRTRPFFMKGRKEYYEY